MGRVVLAPVLPRMADVVQVRGEGPLEDPHVVGHHDAALRKKLRASKIDGLAQLEQTICHHPEFDPDFRRTYLGSHIYYDLGDKEKAGLARFIELLKKHQDRNISDPTFV